MGMEYLSLCIFPLILFIIMLIKIKFAPAGEFYEDYLSLENSKILQGIMAVCVILHHLSQYTTDYGYIQRGPITVFAYMGILFTAIFFFCSGYGLVTSYKNKPDYLNTFFKKRIPTILIPFMISNFIYLIFVGLYFGRIRSMLGCIAAFFGLILVNSNTWFLVEILILYLAFYFIFRKMKKTDCALWVMTGFVVLLMTVSLLLGHDHSETGGRWFMGEWWYNTTIFFVVGMFVAWYASSVLNFFKKNYKWLLPVSIVMFFVTFYVEELVRLNFGYYQEWENHPGYIAKLITLLSQILFCAVWLLLILLINLKVKFKNRLLVLLGKISLELFIMHDIFKVHIVIGKYKREDWVIYLWVFLLSIGAAIILHLVDSFLFGLFLDKKAANVTENLTLEKQIQLKQRKKKRTKLLIGGGLILGLVSVISIKEMYEIFILPRQYYEEECALLSEINVGDEIMFGTFDTVPSNTGKERMIWVVADKKDGQVLLISKYLVAPKEFHDHYSGTAWEYSNLRELLNGYFYEKAFTEAERGLIVSTSVETMDNREFGTSGGEGTQDKVFLLSAEEVEKYLPREEDRRLTIAPVLDSTGINVNAMNGIEAEETDYFSWWWLRTMGETSKEAAIVEANGDISFNGKAVTTASGGVRPAMWVLIPTEE